LLEQAADAERRVVRESARASWNLDGWVRERRRESAEEYAVRYAGSGSDRPYSISLTMRRPSTRAKWVADGFRRQGHTFEETIRYAEWVAGFEDRQAARRREPGSW
jgi:hypothetical protein